MDPPLRSLSAAALGPRHLNVLPRLRPGCGRGVERVGGMGHHRRSRRCTRENETVKKLMLAGMLAVSLVASVAWADCLKDDPYYRCFDWYHAPPGEA